MYGLPYYERGNQAIYSEVAPYTSSSATAATSTEPEFHGQCSEILLPGGGSGHQAPKIWKYHISYLIHNETNSYLLLKVMHYESNAT